MYVMFFCFLCLFVHYCPSLRALMILLLYLYMFFILWHLNVLSLLTSLLFSCLSFLLPLHPDPLVIHSLLCDNEFPSLASFSITGLPEITWGCPTSSGSHLIFHVVLSPSLFFSVLLPVCLSLSSKTSSHTPCPSHRQLCATENMQHFSPAKNTPAV